MKKQLLIFLFGNLLVIIICNQAISCSSFALYADKPIYGMNFDYERFPMKFLIDESDGIKTFHLAFQRPLGGEMVWARTGGMNDRGLFASVQEEYPYRVNPPMPGNDEIFIYQLYDNLNLSGNVAEIETTCKEKKLIQLKAVSVHCMFADITGNAVIAEVGDEKNKVIKIKNKFMVMTNFPNRSLVGKNYKEAKGIGEQRYIAGYEYIKNNSKDFDIAKGMSLLELMKNKSPGYPTCCSMVFDPVNNDIYIALFANYRKILRVSLEDNTIITFKGFNQSRKFNIDSKGVLISALKDL